MARFAGNGKKSSHTPGPGHRANGEYVTCTLVTPGYFAGHFMAVAFRQNRGSACHSYENK